MHSFCSLRNITLLWRFSQKFLTNYRTGKSVKVSRQHVPTAARRTVAIGWRQRRLLNLSASIAWLLLYRSAALNTKSSRYRTTFYVCLTSVDLEKLRPPRHWSSIRLEMLSAVYFTLRDIFCIFTICSIPLSSTYKKMFNLYFFFTFIKKTTMVTTFYRKADIPVYHPIRRKVILLSPIFLT